MNGCCEPVPSSGGIDRPCALANLTALSGVELVPAILDTIDALIVVLDARGHIVSFNKGCERTTGFPCRELYGRPIWETLIPDHERDSVKRVFDRLLSLHIPSRHENHWLTRDGGRRLIAWSNTIVPDESGEALLVVGTGIDVTERRAAEAAQREGEARLQAIVRAAADAIVTIDERGLIESINPAGERMFGYDPGQLDGRSVTVLMPEPFRSAHDSYIAAYLETGQSRVIGRKCEVTGRRSDGETFPVELSVSEVRLGERRLFTAIVHDVTLRKRLEREILEVSANEQRRIGQDLHDGLCQHLTGIAFACQAVSNDLVAQCPKQAGRLDAVRAMVDESIAQARRLARGLQPVLVGPHALPASLKELARHAQELFDVPCRFTWHHDVPDVDHAAATNLYRIAQESITNAVRHGKADRILVRLAKAEGSLRLTIKDNGVGMAAVPGDGRGMGLHIMRYRAGVIGASLEIQSQPGVGTTVTCTLPIQEHP